MFDDMDNKTLLKRIICWVIPLGVGGLSALLSGGMDSYRLLNQPPLSPPGWVFPIVWLILYLLMGEASFRVLNSGAEPRQIKKALTAYAVQLGINFLWSPVFFGGQMYLTAFFVLIGLWIAIFVTLRRFSAINETAGDLIIPYLLWVTFAGYLNLGVFLLN